MVSVIVPVYNAGKYIVECLGSILSQTYADLNIFLVDDGSTDNSGKLCDEYAAKDARITVIHADHGGQAKARNTGLALAEKGRSRYILFADADDFLESDAIRALVDQAETTGADIVVGASCGVRDGEVVYKRDLGVEKNKLYQKEEIVDRVRAFLRNPRESFIAHVVWARLYRQSIIRDNNIRFDESLCTYEDLKFNFQCLKFASSVYFMDSAVYYYRHFAVSFSSNTSFAFEHVARFFDATNIALSDAKSLLEISNVPGLDVTREIGNAIIHHQISQLVKLCAQPEKNNQDRVYAFVANLIRSNIIKDNIKYYRPVDNLGKMAKIMMKLKMVRLLTIVCKHHGLKKYRKRRNAK